MDFTQEMEGSVEDFKTIVASIKANKDSNLSCNASQRLQKLETKYTKLKRQCIEAQTLDHVLKAFSQCAPPDVTNISEQLKEKRKSLRQEKESVREASAKAVELCQQIDEVVTDTEVICKKLEEHKLNLPKQEEKLGTVKQTQQELEQQLIELQQEEQKYQKELEDFSSESSELTKLEDELAKLEDEHKRILEKQQTLRNSDILELQKIIQITESLSIVKSHRIQNNERVFDLRGSDDDDVLTVRVTFKPSATDETVIGNVKVQNVNINIEDIVDNVIETNNIGDLLSKIHCRWLSSADKEKEIEALRKNYVLDWNASLSTIQVLFGKAADILCELKLPESYPHHGDVTLVKVKGHSSDQEIKAPPNNPSLTTWLKYLQELLEPNKAANRQEKQTT